MNMLLKVVLVSLALYGFGFATLPGVQQCVPLVASVNTSLCIYGQNTGDLCQWKYGIRGQG